mgnify:FL=1|tara:strand:+ start:874 stop:2421 length:1548 start_codon:yes stop_codon:yes gene_type:complete
MQQTAQEPPYSIMLIERDDGQKRVIGTFVRDHMPLHLKRTVTLDAVCDLEAALNQVNLARPCLFLADMESVGGIEGVKALKSAAPDAKLISLSGQGALSSAIDAMRAGAWDFLIKPVGKSTLQKRVSEAFIAYRKDCRQTHTSIPSRVPRISAAEKPADVMADAGREQNDAPAFEGFFGRSGCMSELYRQIERVAPSAAPVFITGESGTGKEVCAEALHARSGRKDKPFVAINCSAIPKDLMESELFGHCKGAFTGAVADHPGAAEQADGGTLFLDEVGDMDIALQAKLLRFLQTGAVRRIGDIRLRQVDVRIVCATHHDPHRAVAEKRIREDLFYRLHVLPIFVPPLRQRSDDILLLANRFLRRYAREEGRAFTSFSAQSEACMRHYHWPGNVRELQNVVRQTIVMNDGSAVESRMLPASLKSSSVESEYLAAGQADSADSNEYANLTPASDDTDGSADCRPFWKQEQSIIETALMRYGGNISRAAAALEISPSTIYRKRQSWMSKDDSHISAA